MKKESLTTKLVRVHRSIGAVEKALHPLELFTYFGVEVNLQMWRSVRHSVYGMIRGSPSLRYLWIALLNNGEFIYQYDVDGEEHPFSKVMDAEKTGSLVAFLLIPRDVSKPLHWVIPPRNGRLIYFRWVEQDVVINAKNICKKRGGNRVMYVIGFQATVEGDNRQWLHIVKEDGDYRDANTFGLDWK